MVIAPSIAITTDGVANYNENKNVETEIIATIQNIEIATETVNNSEAIVIKSEAKDEVTVNEDILSGTTLEEVNQKISELKENS